MVSKSYLPSGILVSDKDNGLDFHNNEKKQQQRRIIKDYQWKSTLVTNSNLLNFKLCIWENFKHEFYQHIT